MSNPINKMHVVGSYCLWLTVFLQVVGANNANICTRGIYSRLEPLASAIEVQAYCSSSFPVPPKTVVNSTLTIASTRTRTIPRFSTTTSTQNTTLTLRQWTWTFQIATSTVTRTVTVTKAARRRRQATTSIQATNDNVSNDGQPSSTDGPQTARTFTDSPATSDTGLTSSDIVDAAGESMETETSGSTTTLSSRVSSLTTTTTVPNSSSLTLTSSSMTPLDSDVSSVDNSQTTSRVVSSSLSMTTTTPSSSTLSSTTRSVNMSATSSSYTLTTSSTAASSLALATLTKQQPGVVRTFCSCIETPSTTTITKTLTEIGIVTVTGDTTLTKTTFNTVYTTVVATWTFGWTKTVTTTATIITTKPAYTPLVCNNPTPSDARKSLNSCSRVGKSECACGAQVAGSGGICFFDYTCGKPCNSNADCDLDRRCIDLSGVCGRPTCQTISTCGTPKRPIAQRSLTSPNFQRMLQRSSRLRSTQEVVDDVLLPW